MRHVGALRQLDANRIVLAVSVIILAKLVAQTRGLDAHDGVYQGVERLGAIEDRQSDVVALQPFAAAGQRFIDDVFQEPLPALRLVERAALKDAVQLLANGALVGFAPAIERNYRHAQAPNLRAIPQASGAVSYRCILGPNGTACHSLGWMVNGLNDHRLSGGTADISGWPKLRRSI